MRALVTQGHGRLEHLVVIDAEHTRGERRALWNQPARFRREVSRPRVTERPVGLEAVQIDRAHPSRHPVQLGVVPRDGERERGVQQRTEIVGIVRILPEIVGIDQQVPSQ